VLAQLVRSSHDSGITWRYGIAVSNAHGNRVGVGG
jgi:hypothetical protein